MSSDYGSNKWIEYNLWSEIKVIRLKLKLPLLKEKSQPEKESTVISSLIGTKSQCTV